MMKLLCTGYEVWPNTVEFSFQLDGAHGLKVADFEKIAGQRFELDEAQTMKLVVEMEQQIATAVAAEREACAQLVESFNIMSNCDEFAAIIRERGAED